jgi:threonine aldolase
MPQNEIKAISDYAHGNGIKMHLDGARLWHVASMNMMSMKDLCDPFDSVSLCLSKGLGKRAGLVPCSRVEYVPQTGAPVGSILVGNKEFIKKARRFRKLFGGGMRQIGVLAACSAYALTHHFPLLPQVHALARKLEQGLEAIGAEITNRAETCMVGFLSVRSRLQRLTKRLAVLQSCTSWTDLRRDR